MPMEPLNQSAGEAPACARRVLVVGGDPALLPRVGAALGAPEGAGIGQVEGYLLALGEIGTRGTPELVVGSVKELDGAPEVMAEALRLLAPGARLVLLARPEEEAVARRAVQAGFDEYLLEPVAAVELARASGRGGNGRGGEPLPSAREPEEKTVGAAHPTAALGDIDLVEQLLRQRRGFAELATQVVAQQAGLAGIGLARELAAVPAGRAAVPVSHQGQAFGFLHAAPPADAAALAPWAMWLSRWLALEWRMAGLWEMALRDELTGAWNRRYLHRFFATILQRARTQRFRVTVMVFDIDDFKTYNDRYGHAAGDQILCETVRLMQSVVRTHDVVARIGGDEFAVIFWDAQGPRRPNSEHPDDVRKATRRFREAIRAHKFPKLADDAPGTVTISGGLASFPWDGATAETLLERADQMALQSKRQGKNALTFGPGASCERENGGEA